MKFLICSDDTLREELDGIANGLITNNNEAFGFGASIYKANEEREPDYFVFTENNVKHPEVQDFLKKRTPNYLVVDRKQISFSSGNSINLPSFASTIKYKPQLPSNELACNIAICHDGLAPDKIHVLYHRLHKKYKVKIIGAFINCAGYIGLGSPVDLVKLAKSANITVSDNKVVTNSLLYNNVCAVYDFNGPEQLLDWQPEQLEEYVINSKKDIITETKLGKMICEKLSNTNR